MASASPIKIAIMALGGQGGGVLADWIVALAESTGYVAQATSVPGVAQRTGSTIYYLELFPGSALGGGASEPVLALMPVAGDVDIVIASEIMEAGRAILRGLVNERTTLIASDHRVYAIGEKIAMGDGRLNAQEIGAVAQEKAGRFIHFDMQLSADTAGCPISAVLFGALAGSGALPILPGAFEDAIKRDGRSSEANLTGFALGVEGVERRRPRITTAPEATVERWVVSSQSKALLAQRVDDFPPETHEIVREGVKRLIDYQGIEYAGLYLDRLGPLLAFDGQESRWRLLRETARGLALWMAYEDAIRVAALKTRQSRFKRVEKDIRLSPGQIYNVKEYLHPRTEEICDILPAPLAKAIKASKLLRGVVEATFVRKHRLSTTKLRGFLLLSATAALRPLRRASYRYEIEQLRIGNWLAKIQDAAVRDYDFACEVAALQRLIKGYGETHERSMRSYNLIFETLAELEIGPTPAASLRTLSEAALKDEDGVHLRRALAGHKSAA